MSTLTNDLYDERTCDDPSAAWPVLLAASSVILGFIVGRVTYNRDLRAALRQAEDSSEPVEISIRTL